MTTTINTAEIARLLGVSRAHVTDRLTKRADFPRPAINISQRTRYWRRDDVLAWMRGGVKAAPPHPRPSRGSRPRTTG